KAHLLEEQLMKYRSSPCSSLLATIMAALVLAPAAAPAQELEPDETFVPEEVRKAVTEADEEEEKHEGWDFLLRLGLSGSWAGSSNVIGTADGNTWLLGGLAHHGAYYRTPRHEWSTDTLLSSAFTRTPLLDEWVKSSDAVDIASTYLHHLPGLDWIGPFARARLKTQLFPAAAIRPEEVSWLITSADEQVRVVEADRLHLTDSLSPLTLRQTAGAFVKPKTPETARFEALLGLGARQTYADDQLVVVDEEPGIVQVSELESFSQAGSEIILTVSGKLDEERFTYSGSAGFMTPFLNSLPEGDERSAIDLTNVEVALTFSLRPYEWLSIDYQFRAVKEPQLLEEMQLTNRLLVGISYALIDRSNGGE
ncbi:MAG: hypothetical protein ACOCVR_01565, partial [Myxococcota bacterium]